MTLHPVDQSSRDTRAVRFAHWCRTPTLQTPGHGGVNPFETRGPQSPAKGDRTRAPALPYPCRTPNPSLRSKLPAGIGTRPKKRQSRAKQGDQPSKAEKQGGTGRSSKSSQATKLPAGNKKKARQGKARQDKAGARKHETQDRPKLQIATGNETPGREQKKGKAGQSKAGQSRRTQT